jgi:putative restriction endonuclease
VPPGGGAEVHVSFRDGSSAKSALLCEACASRIPGQTHEACSLQIVDPPVWGEHLSTPNSLEAALQVLPDRHQQALRWFADREGREISWPRPLADGTLLACRPKGIYKPAWSRHALSVRESLRRPYPDEEPVARADGSWTYRYFQENLNPDARDSQFTNTGLLACIEDAVPVGVFRQVAKKPARYQVLGVAFVRAWRDGFFEVESAR